MRQALGTPTRPMPPSESEEWRHVTGPPENVLLWAVNSYFARNGISFSGRRRQRPRRKPIGKTTRDLIEQPVAWAGSGQAPLV